MNTHQPSVILGTNPARNVGKLDNAFATRERVNGPPVQGEKR